MSGSVPISETSSNPVLALSGRDFTALVNGILPWPDCWPLVLKKAFRNLGVDVVPLRTGTLQAVGLTQYI